MIKSFIRKVLLALFILTIWTKTLSLANHIITSDVYYTAKDSLHYEITYRFYRDCNDGSFDTSYVDFTVRADSITTQYKLKGKLASIRKIENRCQNPSNCLPVNTASSGVGMEEFTYVVQFDLTDTNYRKLKSACELFFESSVCCRSLTTNLIASDWVYSYASINRCISPKNNSPKRTEPMVQDFCMNQPMYYSLGCIETDGDSLSYNLEKSYINQWYYSTYRSTYSYIWPLKVYDPTGKGVVNPNAYPPIGLFLNPGNGDFICTPEMGGSFLVSALVKEWKKDKTGKRQLVGTSFKSFVFNVASCPGNNPPNIEGPSSYLACVGDELCIDIKTEDKVKVPPPPATWPKPDTVTISWNKGIVDASFKVISDTARLQTGTFCWTPTLADARKYQHSFQVVARDNSCPTNGITLKTFNIYVKEKVQFHLSTKSLTCGRVAVEALRDSGYSSGASFEWSVFDSVGRPISAKHLIPASRSGFMLSSYAKDTITFREKGTYIIRLEVFGSPKECSVVLFDTIKIVQSVPMYVPADTAVCCPDAMVNLKRFEHATSAGNPWRCLGNPAAIVDDSIFRPNPLCSDTLREFTLSYYNKDTISGCVVSDSFTIEVRGKIPSQLKDLNICAKSSFINPMSEGMTKVFDWKDYKYLWNCIDCSTINWSEVYDSMIYPPHFKVINDLNNLSKNDYRALKLQLTLTDKIGCTDTDSAFFRVLGEPRIDRNLFSKGVPDYVCSSDSALALIKNGYPARWILNGKVLETDFLPIDTLSTGNYQLILNGGNGCSSDSIAFNLIKSVNYQYLPNDTSILSRPNHVEKLFIKEGYDTSIRWYSNNGTSLKNGTGPSNDLTIPLLLNYPQAPYYKRIIVWVNNPSAQKCMTKSDTMHIGLRIYPCKEITFLGFNHLHEARFIVDYPDPLWVYDWRSSLGYRSNSVDFTLPVPYDSTFWVSLKTYANSGDTCTTFKLIKFGSVGSIKSHFQITPNPVTNQLTISDLTISNGDRYSIYDGIGRNIQTGVLTEKIDCSRLQNGYYVLRLHTKKGEVQMPFLKGE